jgi:uncharacterized protein (DUF58 family)
MEQEDFEQFRQSKLQLFSRTKLKNVLPGEWESIYAGEGIEFAAIKPFEPGDDLRDLDLLTLAQSGEEEIVQRVVERQMKILVWVDSSGSMQRFEEMFFSQKPEIKDIALGLLLFSASNAYCPVGLYAFNKEMSRFFPARFGERYCWEILNWIIAEEYRGTPAPADVENAISFLIEAASPQSLVLFVSDFQDQAFDGDFTDLLRPVTKEFDFVAVIIRDPLETEASIRRSVSIAVQDNEGYGNAEIYLTPQRLKELQESSARHLFALEQRFRNLGIEYVVLDSCSVEGCYQALSGFFEARKRIRG